ncbi:MAG: Fe-S cluster assembly ATPase SufC [Dehalococcoidia bacterium]
MTTQAIRERDQAAVGTPALEIVDLRVAIDGKEILSGVDLVVKQGEIHALMGPNGSGKSTLANVVMGHPRYQITQGDIRYNGESILRWSPDQRARAGLFLSFQYPTAIPGVTMVNFMRQALNAKAGREIPVREFRIQLTEKMKLLKMDPAFARRYVNDGFSGGEKKRAEILQLHMFNPTIAVLDETDSGLDVDALRVVAEGVNKLNEDEHPGVLLITHYYRILNYIEPDFVHVLVDGKIVKSGGKELAMEVETQGYENILGELGIERVAGESRVEENE